MSDTFFLILELKKRKWQKHLKSNAVAANFLGPTIIGFSAASASPIIQF